MTSAVSIVSCFNAIVRHVRHIMMHEYKRSINDDINHILYLLMTSM